MSGSLGAQRSVAFPDLRNLIEMVPGLAVCVLPDGLAEFANQAWHAYTGLSLKDISGRDWRNALHPDDIAKFNAQWTATREAKQPFATEARMRRADGQFRRFVIRKAMAIPQAERGAPSPRTFIACEEFDELTQAEFPPRRSETLLRVFLENSPIPKFLKDRRGKYFYINQHFTRFYRLTEEQAIGKSDDELFSPEEAAAFQANDRSVIEAGVPMVFEEATLQEDGRHINFVQKFPLLNAEGEIYAIGGLVTNITQRERDESARRYSEEKYRLLVETASDAIVSIDDKGSIVFANPAIATVFGYDPTELTFRD